jgi:hypothetical protein
LKMRNADLMWRPAGAAFFNFQFSIFNS